jgi:hypothetical protein
MFNIFNTKQKTQMSEEVSKLNQEDQAQVAITYYVDKNDTIVKIDVAVEDYDQESINKLCKILDVLSNEKGYLETVYIIKDGLEKEADEEALINFLMHIGKQSTKTFLNQVQDKVRNQPCIRPSDML